MGKYLILAAIALAAGVGTYLAASLETRDLDWQRQRLQTLQDHLAGVKLQLLDYRRIHGRYPTNDEGLTVLDSWAARFPVTLSVTRSPDGELAFYVPWANTPWSWIWLDNVVRIFRSDNGRLPQNAKDLDVFSDSDFGKYAVGQPFPLDLAIDQHDHVYFLNSAGVLSPWLLPDIYENRAGLKPELFADSPANRDSQRRYCVQVDDGVFLYCIGGEELAAACDAAWWKCYTPVFGGAALLLGVVIALVWLIRRGRITYIAGTVVLGAAVGAGLVVGGITNGATCYVSVPILAQRGPKQTAQQIQLLEKYHARGILGDAAYERARAAADPARAGAASR
jgi:hypothetical protein